MGHILLRKFTYCMPCPMYNNCLALRIAFSQPFTPFSHPFNNILPTSGNHQGSHVYVLANFLPISPISMKHPKHQKYVREAQRFLHICNHFIVEFHIELLRRDSSLRSCHENEADDCAQIGLDSHPRRVDDGGIVALHPVAKTLETRSGYLDAR